MSWRQALKLPPWWSQRLKAKVTQRSAGLDQPPGHQEVLHQFRAAVVAIARVPFAVALANARVFLADVQSFHQPAGGEHAKGLLVEAVEPAHHAGRVGVAAEAIEAGQQGLAVAQAVERDAVEHHVGLALAVGLERGMGHAQKAGLAVVGPFHVSHLGRQADERRHRRMRRAIDFRQHRAQGGPAAGGLRAAAAMAGDALEGVVGAAGADDRADGDQLVHQAGDPRKMLADFDAAHVGFDRLELAADFRGGLHLQVEEILVGRPARQEDHDDRLVAGGTGATSCLGPQNLGERKPAERQSADFQERAAREAVAEAAIRFAEDCQHGNASSSKQAGAINAAGRAGSARALIVSKCLDSFKSLPGGFCWQIQASRPQATVSSSLLRDLLQSRHERPRPRAPPVFLHSSDAVCGSNVLGGAGDVGRRWREKNREGAWARGSAECLLG